MSAEAQPSTSPQPSGSTGGLAGYFKFAERGTNLATEAKAGLTTFMVMAYILFLNPAILSNMFGPPGSPEATAFIPAAAAATALIAGLLTIAMGVIANTPLAMAAGLGINGAVAFGLVLTQGLTPQGEMGVSSVIVGDFGAITVPADLPPDGLIPVDWDGPGNPAAAFQMEQGWSLYYDKPTDPTLDQNDFGRIVLTPAMPGVVS